MESRPQTPAEVAEALYALMPRVVSQSVLDEYHIAAPATGAERITRELLSLNLFWICSAVDTLVPAAHREAVLLALFQRIRAGWTSDFGFDPDQFEAYFPELDARRGTYGQVVREGGSPVSVFTETVTLLELSRVIEPEDRKKLLALLIDMIPVDAYGDLMENLELRDA